MDYRNVKSLFSFLETYWPNKRYFAISMKRAAFAFVFLMVTLLNVGDGYAAMIDNFVEIEQGSEIAKSEIAINISGRYSIKRTSPNFGNSFNRYFLQRQGDKLNQPCYHISTCTKTPRFIQLQVIRH